jgi:hypothetical protein
MVTNTNHPRSGHSFSKWSRCGEKCPWGGCSISEQDLARDFSLHSALSQVPPSGHTSHPFSWALNCVGMMCGCRGREGQTRKNIALSWIRQFPIQNYSGLRGQAPSYLRKSPSVCTKLPVGIGDITGHFACVILIQPAIRQCLLNIWPLHRIWFQEGAQEVDGPWKTFGKEHTHPCYRLNTSADAASSHGEWPRCPTCPSWASAVVIYSLCVWSGWGFESVIHRVWI